MWAVLQKYILIPKTGQVLSFVTPLYGANFLYSLDDDEVKDVDVTLEELSDIISSQSVSFVDFEPVWSMLLAYITPLKHIYNLYR